MLKLNGPERDGCAFHGKSTAQCGREPMRTAHGAVLVPETEKAPGHVTWAAWSGAKENRTPDLVIANDALYQLSYSPKCNRECSAVAPK